MLGESVSRKQLESLGDGEVRRQSFRRNKKKPGNAGLN
jgi:hypothetical protein